MHFLGRENVPSDLETILPLTAGQMVVPEHLPLREWLMPINGLRIALFLKAISMTEVWENIHHCSLKVENWPSPHAQEHLYLNAPMQVQCIPISADFGWHHLYIIPVVVWSAVDLLTTIAGVGYPVQTHTTYITAEAFRVVGVSEGFQNLWRRERGGGSRRRGRREGEEGGKGGRVGSRAIQVERRRKEEETI